MWVGGSKVGVADQLGVVDADQFDVAAAGQAEDRFLAIFGFAAAIVEDVRRCITAHVGDAADQIDVHITWNINVRSDREITDQNVDVGGCVGARGDRREARDVGNDAGARRNGLAADDGVERILNGNVIQKQIGIDDISDSIVVVADVAFKGSVDVVNNVNRGLTDACFG